MSNLENKIQDGSAHVAIIGLGYVGLPLALGFASAGFHVTGVEIDERKIALLNQGRSYIDDVEDADLAPHIGSGLLRATDDYDVLEKTDAIFICVILFIWVIWKHISIISNAILISVIPFIRITGECISIIP